MHPIKAVPQYSALLLFSFYLFHQFNPNPFKISMMLFIFTDWQWQKLSVVIADIFFVINKKQFLVRLFSGETYHAKPDSLLRKILASFCSPSSSVCALAMRPV